MVKKARNDEKKIRWPGSPGNGGNVWKMREILNTIIFRKF